MPEITVWPVSSSDWTRKVGSSSDSENRARDSLSWSALVLGSTATWMTGSGKVSDSRIDRVVRVAQGVAGGGLLEAHGGDDVAGVGDVEVLAGVGVHLEDAAHPLLAVLGGVEHARALGQGARVDPQVGELAHVGVGHDLEGQGGEGGGVVGRPLDGHALLAGDRAHGRRDVERAGQVVDHGVEHGLDALVLEGRAAQDGDGVAAQGDGADGPDAGPRG